jgi:ribulose-phosphate 3-epimerase
MLSCNYARFGTEAVRVARAKGDWMHLDIMDGHFVPNISFGPGVVKSIRPLTRMFFDVHLMCSKPEILLEPFLKAGANQLTIHIELGDRVPDLLWRIRSLGIRVGLAINPPTALSLVEPYLSKIDTLLVMTVNPGFGGQPFIEETLPKIQQAHVWRVQRGLRYDLEVDGGITHQTAMECARVGANVFVSGTGLFGEPNLIRAVRKMRGIAERAFGLGVKR